MKYVYRAQKNSKRQSYPVMILFFALLFGFTILNFFWPKRQISELENRMLAQMPKLEWSSLLDGSWTSDFSEYLQDQVAFRDTWIDLQSDVKALAFQNVEQNGILLGSDHWLFTKLFGTPSTAQLDKNTNAVAEFAQKYPGRVTFLLAPSASVIYPEELPVGAPMVDENALLDQVFETVSASADVIDMRQVYPEHKEEYLYYRTDHHWTTHGAYLAYEQFCALKGLTPFDPSAEQTVEVPDFYGTHYSATRFWNAEPDTITYYSLDNPMTIYQLTGEASFEPVETVQLMDPDKLETQDKYGAFLHGNNGYSVIEGDGEGSILVVKDSYGNCFVPYLTKNYAKIGVVDFRDFHYGLDTTIEKEGYDQILILYNFQTFMSDRDVINLIRPSTLQ